MGMLRDLNRPAATFLLTAIAPLTIRAVSFPVAAPPLIPAVTVIGHSLRIPARERLPMMLPGLLSVF